MRRRKFHNCAKHVARPAHMPIRSRASFPFLERLALRHLDAAGRALDEGGERCGDIRILARRASCFYTLRLEISELRLDVLGPKPEVVDSGAVARTGRRRCF